ncbi:YHS domain-containing protein [Cognatiyoonia koreensis]|uniref:YHS domain-containing protein n=1 Tax=Cognatiyoonia koreensis TaxID=364200 RepID=A0A1I0P963_9RHOB|nr:YHS domain-containing (seleno)protein [Cognatiyoonia koreensis]SEW10839.1 YHS domain-containing protein [Cognatiyoonia koreensis]
MSMSRRAAIAGLILVPAVAIGVYIWPASADEGSVYSHDGIAVDGTDVVAYFTEGQPVAGLPAHTHDWMGATWQFSSAENRDTFAADPETYAPQYGGFCAYAVANGSTASTVPEAWKIVDGKLYLNFSTGIQRRWEEDIPGYIDSADANWPDVLN